MRSLTTAAIAMAFQFASSDAAFVASPVLSCESLAAQALPHATITRVTASPAGDRNLPAHCEVAATLTPVSDSEIKIEVWMPAEGWNGKLEGVGNGGFSGSINTSALMAGLRRGYAVASTNTGHDGSSGSFALGHPEKLIDFGYRAVHEMTIAAKTIVSAYYGSGATKTYWNGCSAGGRQGLMEAQRYPADYDGIVAGAPASDWTGRAAASLRVAAAVHRDDSSALPAALYPMVHRAVLDACDELDGVKDGVLENPRACRFDPGTLACRAGATTSCLTPAQVETVRTIYTSGTNPRTGRAITSLEPGSELGWATWGGAQPLSMGLDHFRYIVFKQPDWDYRTFDLARDVARAEEIDGGTVNALDPNLRPFFARGGKIVQYHGWSDPQISPGNSVQYYTRVLETLGGRAAVDDSYRLFMAPGMAHCGNGDGPNTFDMLGALENWVERGQAPASVVASLSRNGAVVRTRPLCPFPSVASYRGTGSTDEAANFTCSTGARGPRYFEN